MLQPKVLLSTALSLTLVGSAFAQNTLTVVPQTLGNSSMYFGANGGDYFSLAEVKDLGLNSYRLFMGMERSETSDDDGRYGYPTVDDMKGTLSNNPSRIGDFVNFARYDVQMKSYGEFLKQLHTIPGMEPLVVLRNSANWGNVWVPNQASNGPACKDSAGKTVVWREFNQQDLNEMWEFTVAAVYWINVRNGNTMRVDHWSAHNEPNQTPEQGWCGTKEQYQEYITITKDAVDFVYRTYLNNRPHWIHGGALSARSYTDWMRKIFRPNAANGYDPSQFDVVDFHAYSGSWGSFDYANILNTIHGLQNETGVGPTVKTAPVWMSEWGYLGNSAWDSIQFSVQVLATNLVRYSTPGSTFVWGQEIWRMFDSKEFGQGLVAKDEGNRKRPGYYAYKLLIEAFKGKPVFKTTTSQNDSQLLQITTQIDPNNYWLVLVNNSTSATKSVKVDLSSLGDSGSASVYQFSSARKDSSSLNPLSTTTWSQNLSLSLPALSVTRVKVSINSVSAPIPTPAPDKAPNIGFSGTVPTGGVAPFTANFTAQATDADGSVTKVELYQNGALIQTKLTAPYTFSVASLPAGTYAFSLRAYDNSQLASESAAAIVTVTAPAPQVPVNLPPTVSFATAPNTGVAPFTAVFTALAADSDGKVAKVELYKDNTLVQTELTSPYNFSAAGLATGSYHFKLKAYDDKGATTMSTEAVVAVTAPAPALEVVSLSLIDSGTDKVVKTVANGEIIKRSAYPNGFTLIANVGGIVPGSIAFALNGTFNHQENTAPFVISGDSTTAGKTDYASWSIGPGTYRITTTPYTKSNRQGTTGKALDLSVTVQ